MLQNKYALLQYEVWLNKTVSPSTLTSVSYQKVIHGNILQVFSKTENTSAYNVSQYTSY